jgi:hypothetical protein
VIVKRPYHRHSNAISDDAVSALKKWSGKTVRLSTQKKLPSIIRRAKYNVHPAKKSTPSRPRHPPPPSHQTAKKKHAASHQTAKKKHTTSHQTAKKKHAASHQTAKKKQIKAL